MLSLIISKPKCEKAKMYVFYLFSFVYVNGLTANRLTEELKKSIVFFESWHIQKCLLCIHLKSQAVTCFKFDFKEIAVLLLLWLWCQVFKNNGYGIYGVNSIWLGPLKVELINFLSFIWGWHGKSLARVLNWLYAMETCVKICYVDF